MEIETESIMIQTLCVPCMCRCRYCLISWDGKTVGASWERSTSFARRFMTEAKILFPDIKCDFSFGYSMDHPGLKEAIRFLKEIGSPQAEFLQCDGMKQRNEEECGELVSMLGEEGIKKLNFTVYGMPAYHDRFAGRKGDFDLILRMMRAAAKEGIVVSSGIPLTKENAGQISDLTELLGSECGSVRLFIPHEEGRGHALSSVRLSTDDFDALPEKVKQLMNRKVYRSEKEWLAKDLGEEKKRSIIISLRQDNMERYEMMSAEEIVKEIEALDEEYYDSFPGFKELGEMYGDPECSLLYSRRDLFYHYRKLYEKEYNIDIYDVTDERQSGSRRYQ